MQWLLLLRSGGFRCTGFSSCGERAQACGSFPFGAQLLRGVRVLPDRGSAAPWQAQLLRGVRVLPDRGSAAPWHAGPSHSGLSCSVACGSFPIGAQLLCGVRALPNRGSGPCALHWQAFCPRAGHRRGLRRVPSALTVGPC